MTRKTKRELALALNLADEAIRKVQELTNKLYGHNSLMFLSTCGGDLLKLEERVTRDFHYRLSLILDYLNAEFFKTPESKLVVRKRRTNGKQKHSRS